MTDLLSSIVLSIVTSLLLVLASVTANAQLSSGEKDPPVGDSPSKADAALLQKKAAQAQTRIRANKNDRDQLMVAVKTNEVPLAKEVLLRNGFTARDLENARIILRTGGGKSGEDEIVITASCCAPREITIQRSLGYFTK